MGAGLIPPSGRRAVLAAALAAFVVRLAWAAHVGPEIVWPDAQGYMHLAREIRAGRPYALPWHGVVRSLYPPGYPVLLAAATGALGERDGVRAVQALQAALGAVVVLLCAAAAERLRPRAGPWAAWIFALEPWSVYVAGHVLTETVGIALLFAGTFLLFRAVEGEGGPGMALGAGAVLGLAAMTRTAAWPITAGVAAAAGGIGRRRCAAALSVAVLGLLAVASPWAGRNYLVHGHLVFTSTDGGRNLFGANHAGATEHTFAAPPEMLRAFDALYARRGEYEADRALKDLAIQFIRENPGTYALLAIGRTGRLWSPIPHFAGAGTVETAASLAGFALLVPAALAGLAAAARRGAGAPPAAAVRWAAYLAAAVLSVTLLHALTTSSIRYRIPAHPYLAALGGAGAAAAAEAWRRRRSSAP